MDFSKKFGAKIWDFQTFHLASFLKGVQAQSAREARVERRSREKPRSGKYGSHVLLSRVHPSLQYVSTPYFLVVDTVAVGVYSTKVNRR